MLLRVLTAAETLPTSPLLAEEMSGGSGLGEGVLGAGAEVVLVGPELELRMTRPPVPWSWERERTRLECPGPGPGALELGGPAWWSDMPVVLETWE